MRTVTIYNTHYALFENGDIGFSNKPDIKKVIIWVKLSKKARDFVRRKYFKY